MAIFEGAGVALVTPFKENGTVNYEVLESLIEEQIAGGTDCIVAMGTTGESATTSEEEHIQVIRFVCEVVNGRIPVVAGTGSNCTQTAVELSVEAEEAGADGVLLVSPYYNKATQNGLKAHFTKIANSIKIPAILYNVPSRTGVNIAPETIVDLCRHVENIVGVKEASGNFSAAELNEYIATIKEGGEVSAKEFPSYLSVFISDYFNTPAESAVLHEDHLAALYYEYAMKCGNKFVSSWFEFNLTINNILIAFSARKYKWDIAQNVVGNTEVCEALRTSGARDFGLSGEVDCLEQLMKISEITELVEREKKLDSLRWNWMEEATFFDYFTVERIFAFLLQLEMIERWIALDKEKGNQLFRSIIDALKDEVQIPAEFR